MKYFYIICRDKQIFEIPFTEENYQTTAKEIINKGLMAIKPNGHKIPIIINSVDVVKILDEENYDNHINTTRPAMYISNGVWRSGKDHQIIKYEKWKQELVDKRQMIDDIWKCEDLSFAEKERRTLQIENNNKLI